MIAVSYEKLSPTCQACGNHLGDKADVLLGLEYLLMNRSSLLSVNGKIGLKYVYTQWPVWGS